MASVALCFASTAEAAAPICFKSNEIEAEQAILFQTKLMVVSDVCSNASYRSFTVRNREAIIGYQHQMIEHFRRIGGGKPETAFDRYMTKLANEASLTTGSQPVSVVCSGTTAEVLTTADKLDKDSFRHLMSTTAAKEKAHYRACKE